MGVLNVLNKLVIFQKVDVCFGDSIGSDFYEKFGRVARFDDEFK